MIFATVPEPAEESSLLAPLRPHAREANTFSRTVTDPFLVPEFVAALEASGRRTVIIAGVSAEVGVLQASFGALKAGYRVYVPVDAIGSRSERTEAAALREIERAGAVTTSVRSLLLRLTPDLSKAPGRDILGAISSL